MNLNSNTKELWIKVIQSLYIILYNQGLVLCCPNNLKNWIALNSFNKFDNPHTKVDKNIKI